MLDSKTLFSSILKNGTQIEHDPKLGLYVYSIENKKFEYKREQAEASLKRINSSVRLRGKEDCIELEFEDSSIHWKGGYEKYLYSNLNNFFRDCIKLKKVPESYFVVEPRLSESDSNSPELSKIRSMVNWSKLLELMADHVQDNDVMVFFVHQKEGKTKPYEISPFLNFDAIKDLDFDSDHSRFEHLFESWQLKDAHQKSRQSVMLVSFSETISSLDKDENIFIFFLKNTKKFCDRYDENYDIYVNRFSVDVQLQEIDEQYLSFIGKLQDLVSSAQNKAFALPGVMVAMGALIKSSTILGVCAVIIGAIMTKMLISKSNEFLMENLEHFESTFERALGQYLKKRTEDCEVKDHASKAKRQLEKQLSRSKNRVKFINHMANVMLASGLLIASLMLFDAVEKNKIPELETARSFLIEKYEKFHSWMVSTQEEN